MLSKAHFSSPGPPLQSNLRV